MCDRIADRCTEQSPCQPADPAGSRDGGRQLPGVSAHTPAREVTWVRIKLFPSQPFQSAPPSGGRLLGPALKLSPFPHFNPRPLRQERQIGRYSDRYNAISTHAPCEGSGTSKTCFLPAKSNFNPRPHVGNDILVLEIDIGLPIISIHTPYTGSGGGRCGSTDGAGEERRLTADYPIRTQVTPAGRADPSTLTV